MRLYHLKTISGELIATNIDTSTNYYDLFIKCKSKNELIQNKSLQIRHGIINVDQYEFYFCTNEKIKSSRLFKEYRKVYLDTLLNQDNFRKNINSVLNVE